MATPSSDSTRPGSLAAMLGAIETPPEDVGEQHACGNLLLRAMPATDYDLLRPCLRRIPLQCGASYASAGAPIDGLCFMEGAIAGQLSATAEGGRLTTGLVGREGALGWPLLLGNRVWPHDVAIRGENSTALRIDADAMLAALARSDTLRDLMLRFVGAMTSQMGQTIVSNSTHAVERRTARWILLYHDRLGHDEIAMTHEELGLMLGVRRASITAALHELEGRLAIRSLRGCVVIRDRALLERIVGDAYGFAEAEYRRLIGPAAA